ncbi:MAG: hypothetical protein ACYCRD_03095 [Leptospirillum sp.]|jgi:hypothetical protein|uniref:Uncharacterized protein n=1 Tax=Leptospirillum ferriphilum TaxID=178606 RepID=A0A7C3QQX4_9BACT
MSGNEIYDHVSRINVVMVYGFLAVMAGGLVVVFLQWVYQRFVRRTHPPEYTEKPRIFRKD